MENAIIQGRAISIGDLKTALDKSYSKTKVKTGFGDFQVDSINYKRDANLRESKDGSSIGSS